MWLPDLTFRKAQAYQKPKFRSGDIFVGLKCGIFNFAFKWRGVIKCLAEKLLENDVTQIGSKDTQKQYEFIDIFRGSKFSYLIRGMSKCCKSQDTLRPDTEFYTFDEKSTNLNPRIRFEICSFIDFVKTFKLFI